MRIVQAVGWFFPERTGGTEVYVASLARRLQERGHDVRIVAPAPGDAAPRRYAHDGVEVWRYPTVPVLTRDQAQGRAAVPGADWFHRWIAEVAPDVVHFHTLVPGLAMPEVHAARAAAPRIIATTHASSLGHLCARGTLMRWGMTPCDGVARPAKCAACDLQKRGLRRSAAYAPAMVPPRVGELLRSIPGKVGTTLGMTAAIAFNLRQQQALLATVDRFVLLTGTAVEIVARNGAPAGKLALNRLGIDRVAAIPSALRSTARTPLRIGYVGRFDPIKGVIDFARAVASLSPAVRLSIDIRGPLDTPESVDVRRQVERIVAGDPRVALGDPLAPAEVAAHLASLDVLCCPSVCLEGGPTVALEAHAVATPVIGTRIGGLAEIIQDGRNGRLVAPGDSGALAAVLADIARDPAVVASWRAALGTVRTMDEVTTDYLELYAA